MEHTAPLSAYEAGEKILEILTEETNEIDEGAKSESADDSIENIESNQSLTIKEAGNDNDALGAIETPEFMEEKIEIMEEMFLDEVDRFESIDLQKMENEDPETYKKMIAEKDALHVKINKFLEEKNNLKAKEHQKKSDSVLHEQTILKEKMGWSDAQKESADKKEIIDFIKGQGLQEKDLNDLVDHRYILILHKAMLYDKAQKAKNVIAKPKKATFQKPKVGGKIAQQPEKIKRMEKLRRSGSVYDAAEILMNSI